MLKDKAAANLKAGEALLALGLVDAAVNRYYYALYQASVHVLALQGRVPGQVRSGAIEWGHGMVLSYVAFVRGRRSDYWLYRDMRDMRTQADYDNLSVDPGRLAARVGAIKTFVEEAVR